MQETHVLAPVPPRPEAEMNLSCVILERMELSLALEVLSHCRIADVPSPGLSWLGFVVEERGLLGGLDAAERIGIVTEFEAMAAWRSILTLHCNTSDVATYLYQERRRREKKKKGGGGFLRGIII